MGKCGRGFGKWHQGKHHDGSPHHHHRKSHEGHPPFGLPFGGFPGMMFPPGFPFHQ